MLIGVENFNYFVLVNLYKGIVLILIINCKNLVIHDIISTHYRNNLNFKTFY